MEIRIELLDHMICFYIIQDGDVAAYCELKNDLRHFELKRINKIELLDEKF